MNRAFEITYWVNGRKYQENVLAFTRKQAQNDFRKKHKDVVKFHCQEIK